MSDIKKHLIIIGDCLKENKLSDNESKTENIIFYRKSNLPPINLEIRLNGIELERVEITKFLGVFKYFH